MKPIRVFTPQLQLLAEIDNYESLIFTRRWHKPGEFELRINRHKKDADQLQKGNLIILSGDTSKVGIIKHLEISLDENGKASEQWLIKGTALSGVTNQRITIPPAGQAYDNITAPAETVMKHYIEANLVNPADANRKIDLLTIAADQGRGQSVPWQSRYKNLADELEAISLASGLGWDIYLDFDLMKWVFEVYVGRDLTVFQSVNPPVIFSPDFGNIRQQGYIESDYNYRNVGIVGGQGEGVARTIVTVGTATGLDRKEVFIDARDEETNLAERGAQKLAEMSREVSLEGEILPYSSFKYEEDYDLGDIVTVQNKGWGITLDARITEVVETYDSSGFGLDLVFGNKVPTILTKIKQEFKQVEGEITK